MNITRHNYEEYFLLYVDNELSPFDRNAVEVFVQDNPDLRKELLMFQQSVLHIDKRMLFDDKASLLKDSSPASPVNETNCQEYFLLYGDDELSNEEKDQVEQFVYKYPQHQADFELIQQVRFAADNSVVFPDKQSIYRREKDERVIVMRWWQIAAAAVAILFIGGAGWYFSINNNAIKGVPIASTEVDTLLRKTIIATPGKNDNITQMIPTEIKTVDNSTISGKKIIEEVQKTDRTAGKEQQPVLVKNIIREKINSENGSNILKDANVTPNEMAMVKVPDQHKESTEEISTTKPSIIDEAVSFEKLGENDPQSNASYANNTSDRIEVLNTTISNKNRMRGFFRKVSRVVDKATSFGNGDNSDNKKGLRIANFEIALK